MNIWKHGRFVDLWSVVHLTSGMALALACLFLGSGFWTSFLIATSLLIGWEVFEWAIGIIEPSLNVTIDLVLGVLGFVLGSYVYYSFESGLSIIALGISFVTVLVLSVLGFVDFRIKGYQ